MISILGSELRDALIVLGVIYLVAAAVIGATLSILLLFVLRFVRQFTRLRGEHLVHCPNLKQFAVIRVDALHGSISGLMNDPDLRLLECSRWPAHSHCDRACLCATNGFFEHRVARVSRN